jgi:hypothetical protein
MLLNASLHHLVDGFIGSDRAQVSRERTALGLGRLERNVCSWVESRRDRGGSILSALFRIVLAQASIQFRESLLQQGDIFRVRGLQLP